MARDPFSDEKAFNDAKDNGGGVYAMPGYYPEVLITGIKAIDCQSDNCSAVVIEYDIIKSSVPECPPAKGYSFVMKDKHKSFFSNVKRIVAVFTGAPFEQMTIPICKGACSPAQPLAGTKATLRVTNTMTKGSPGNPSHPYSAHTFGLLELSPAWKALIAPAPA